MTNDEWPSIQDWLQLQIARVLFSDLSALQTGRRMLTKILMQVMEISLVVAGSILKSNLYVPMISYVSMCLEKNEGVVECYRKFQG
jgi:hypothetical protein